MLLIYLVRLNINESQCNWLWIKVNQSQWHKFQLIQLIEIDQIEKKQFQWTGSISLTRSNWHNWINWCNMTMENKLTDSQKPGLLVQEHPQDQSIHLPHMKMVHFWAINDTVSSWLSFNWHNWIKWDMWLWRNHC